MRLRLAVAYDGADFSGWAVQPTRRTVQGELEAALSTVLRVPVTTGCAGRTDAGVHARGQVCHADVPDTATSNSTSTATLDPGDLRRRLARLLPADIRVPDVRLAAPGFDARFSAQWRRYAYRVCDDPAALDPLQRHRVLAWPRPLDTKAMDAAATTLLGEHDFAAFCRRREGATTIRTLLSLTCDRRADGVLETSVVADAFCHNMVRALVGALLAVGEGTRPTGWPAEVLASGRRDPGVRVLPPHGLTLEEVGYPDDADLAERARLTRAVRVPAAAPRPREG